MLFYRLSDIHCITWCNMYAHNGQYRGFTDDFAEGGSRLSSLGIKLDTPGERPNKPVGQGTCTTGTTLSIRKLIAHTPLAISSSVVRVTEYNWVQIPAGF